MPHIALLLRSRIVDHHVELLVVLVGPQETVIVVEAILHWKSTRPRRCSRIHAEVARRITARFWIALACPIKTGLRLPEWTHKEWPLDRKSTRLNSSHLGT